MVLSSGKHKQMPVVSLAKSPLIRCRDLPVGGQSVRNGRQITSPGEQPFDSRGTESTEIGLRQAERESGPSPQQRLPCPCVIEGWSDETARFSPSTACLLQNKLGIRSGGPAFDIQAVCSGFVYALSTANQFIRSGQSKCALVVGAETMSRIVDWTDRNTCVLFGDGAGAVILQASETEGIISTHLHADGAYKDLLSVDGGGCGVKREGDPRVVMDGSAVFKFAVGVLDSIVEETLSANGIRAGFPPARRCDRRRPRRERAACVPRD